ncbi:unnamed protein product [Onchocerca flexuosa]|nr:unnamed protein product [Onchocerca flexuosa]
MMTPRPAILRPMRLQALQKFFMLIPRIPPVSVQQPALCPVEAAFSEGSFSSCTFLSRGSTVTGKGSFGGAYFIIITTTTTTTVLSFHL